MKALIATLMLTALPCAALAGGFPPPQGCQLVMTVQQRGCTVAHHYTCAADQPGDRWTAFADQDGIYYVTRIDRETRWIESRNITAGTEERLIDTARDHASFSTLLDEGRDSFDFATQSSDGTVTRFRGEDRLTGATRVIDGVTLEETEFDMVVQDASGAELLRRDGHQFINREMRLFFGGTETIHTARGDDVLDDETPVTFAFPGDPGFGAAEPEYDCDVLMTHSAPETLQGDPQDARI